MKRLGLLALLAWTISTHAAIVQIDYSYDIANGNFFGSNPTAKAALDAAALDLGNAITGSLNPVLTDVYSGMNGSTTATFNWALTIPNPTTGATTTINTFTFAANSVTIAVGMRPLLGATLGIGGPSGAGISLGLSGFAGSIENEFVGAIAAAESSSNASMPRGGGPVIGALSGSSTIGATTANYTVRYGAMLGSLSLDSDSNDDTVADDPTTLSAYWHFDHTTAVVAGKNDFYSVALHELVHAIGFGTSDTWNSKVSGTTWTGSEAGGPNMISADGGHIADGKMSIRISDGGAQEVLMDPSLTQGTRKSLTQLDLAFLRDIGYTTVPEPSTGVLFLAAGTLILASRRRKVNAV